LVKGGFTQPKHTFRPNSPSITRLARALSKLGFCSRSQAHELILAGKVSVNARIQRNPEFPVSVKSDRLTVEGQAVQARDKTYLMLNKPRGLVTSASDEQGRATVYECLEGSGLPFVSPVGRLDKASEGLLLLTNDTAWAARITNPDGNISKTYHVQIDALAGPKLLEKMREGIPDQGELLRVQSVSILRTGERNCWLEIVLTEGKNRHIRRVSQALGVGVLRLIRVAIGDLPLGNLPKGSFRQLSPEEVRAIARSSSK